jgi:pimeloyl-ACP methyl ester carboxylesterase
MTVPQTNYARSGEASIAYQVVGEGPIDLLFPPGWISQVEQLWELPALRRFLERLASFSRLILFDRRGVGLSDRVSRHPSRMTRPWANGWHACSAWQRARARP